MNSTNWRCIIIYSYCILCSTNKTFLLSEKINLMRNRQMLHSLGIFLNFNNTSTTCKHTCIFFLPCITSTIWIAIEAEMYIWPSMVNTIFLFSITKAESNNTAQEVRSLALSASLSPVQKVQQLQLLNGKLRSSLRRLYALQREKAKLQHRVRFL